MNNFFQNLLSFPDFSYISVALWKIKRIIPKLSNGIGIHENNRTKKIKKFKSGWCNLQKEAVCLSRGSGNLGRYRKSCPREKRDQTGGVEFVFGREVFW